MIVHWHGKAGFTVPQFDRYLLRRHHGLLETAP